MTTINTTDLMLAILSLDAYNQGDNPGMTLPVGAPTVGGAQLSRAAQLLSVQPRRKATPGLRGHDTKSPI